MAKLYFDFKTECRDIHVGIFILYEHFAFHKDKL